MKILRIILFTMVLMSFNCNSKLLDKELIIVMSENSGLGHYVIVFNTERGEEYNTDSVFFDQNNIVKIKNIDLPKNLNNVKFIKKRVEDNKAYFKDLPVDYNYNCNDSAICVFGVVTGKTFTHQSKYLLFLYGCCDSSEVYLNREAKKGFDD